MRSFTSKALIFCSVLLASSVNASKMNTDGAACRLKMFEGDLASWHDLIEGITYALYNEPAATVDDCPLCDKLGRHVGGI